MQELIQAFALLLLTMLAISVILTAIHYPYDTDLGAISSVGAAKAYYGDAYNRQRENTEDRFVVDEEYVLKARAHAAAAGIPQLVNSFVKAQAISEGRVLEIGAGSGLLQDLVRRYVSIDLSLSAKRFFTKPFVAASATDIPFRADVFDAAWSIWVLEHIETPEKALTEIRRVVKDGGHILLRPAWNCDSWAADGYEVRPYSDFGLKGKIIKASIPLRISPWFIVLYARTVRLMRVLETRWSGKPSRLHYKRLRPNYGKYWVTDSDAVVSIDFFEVFLWFHSRGDSCINCPPLRTLLFGRPGQRPEALMVRVRKDAGHSGPGKGAAKRGTTA